jgi:predicted dienelactone hydrolase
VKRVARRSVRGRVAAAAVALAVVAGLGAQRGETAPRQLGQTFRLAGLDCSVWEPPPTGAPVPLVVFSHGFHGNRNQSTFLTAALARAGYLVIAPNHADAMAEGRGTSGRPELPFQRPDEWNDTTFQDRARDIRSLLAALHSSDRFSSRVDWSRVGLAGHSLGGYTVLGLAGAWPSWQMAEVKAVLALSPYASPYARHRGLAGMHCPVMYQTGTLDVGVAPFLIRPGGVYDKTAPPAYLVELRGAGHFAWTDLNPRFQETIDAYAVAFLDRHLKGDAAADPARRREGVADLRVK